VNSIVLQVFFGEIRKYQEAFSSPTLAGIHYWFSQAHIDPP
jgi:hypothetical protein